MIHALVCPITQTTRMNRLVEREEVGIDVNVLRFDSESMADALIARHQAGVQVRVNTETSEYRSVSRPLISYILDKLYAAEFRSSGDPTAATIMKRSQSFTASRWSSGAPPTW